MVEQFAGAACEELVQCALLCEGQGAKFATEAQQFPQIADAAQVGGRGAMQQTA